MARVGLCIIMLFLVQGKKSYLILGFNPSTGQPNYSKTIARAYQLKVEQNSFKRQKVIVKREFKFIFLYFYRVITHILFAYICPQIVFKW